MERLQQVNEGRKGAGTYGVTFLRTDGSRIAGAVVEARSMADAMNRAVGVVFGPGMALHRDPQRNLAIIRSVDTGRTVAETRLRVERRARPVVMA